MTRIAPTLEFFYFDAGGGHRNAALALREVIGETYPDWRIKLVNLQDELRPIDPFSRAINVDTQDIYNKALKRGYTYGGKFILLGLKAGIRYRHDEMGDLLRAHWRKSTPDLVVSFIPNFNGVMFRALRDIHPETPYVTVMTDIADYPPRFWQEKQNQYIICGSPKAAKQADEAGYRPEQILRASGMILKADFYRSRQIDRRAGRLALGLDPEKATALVMFGGHGSRQSLQIVNRLHKSGLPVQTIVMCGHNDKLRSALSSLSVLKGIACHAVEFTPKVADYMALGDFFIGKPGPGSISEALHMGLPVIVEDSLRTMPQERYNIEWIKENGLGIAVSGFRQIAGAVASLLAENTLARFRANALALNNRAVYEIPAMLAAIMDDKALSTEHRRAGQAGNSDEVKKLSDRNQ